MDGRQQVWIAGKEAGWQAGSLKGGLEDKHGGWMAEREAELQARWQAEGSNGRLDCRKVEWQARQVEWQADRLNGRRGGLLVGRQTEWLAVW